MPINQQFSMPIHRHFSLPLDNVTGRPVVFSAAFFTNFAWHWEGDTEPGYGSQFVVLPDLPNVPLPLGELKLLDEALAQYAFLPGSPFQRSQAA